MAIIGGVKSVRIGSHLPSVGDTVDITMGGVTRTSEVGLTGVPGQSEVHRPGRIEVEFIDDGTVSLDALTQITNKTVTVVTPLGTYALRNAAQVEDVVLNQATGRYTIVFEGPDKVRRF